MKIITRQGAPTIYNVAFELTGALPQEADVEIIVADGQRAFIIMNCVVTTSESGAVLEQVAADILLNGDALHALAAVEWDATPHEGSTGVLQACTPLLEEGEHTLNFRWRDGDGNGAQLGSASATILVF
jgi:hypothetical protein